MTNSQSITDLIDQTPFVDTHEHLFEESKRLQALEQSDVEGIPVAAPDFGLLFSHYSHSDLESAGMPQEDVQKLFRYDLEPEDKWRLVEPFYQKTYHTGYVQSIRESVRLLYEEEDLRSDNIARISDRIRADVQPGYYHRILSDVARIEHTQVNNLDTPVFMETEYPDLLCQDLNFKVLSSDLDLDAITEVSGREVGDLDDLHNVIDWCFATYGPRAIAAKNPSAYRRRLDYAQVQAQEAAPLLDRYLKNQEMVTQGEIKALKDHLFHYCVERATEYGLPVKLHTGYYARTGEMPLHRVRKNASDLCDLFMAHPKARFVVMHIIYPYQDEAIALAKQYPNAFIDLCWAWIINPAASVRFVKEFLMAAPANKLFTFGGDYLPVELVPGHAQIARRGLAQAISELVDEGWIRSNSVDDLVERLMRGNAHELFDYSGTLAQWEKDPELQTGLVS